MSKRELKNAKALLQTCKACKNETCNDCLSRAATISSARDVEAIFREARRSNIEHRGEALAWRHG